MKPAPFSYHAPKTVDEAVAKLAELSANDGRILAGGQSLVPMMAFRMARPGHLIDINNVAGFDRLAVEGDTLSIAPCVRHAAWPPARTEFGCSSAKRSFASSWNILPLTRAGRTTSR